MPMIVTQNVFASHRADCIPPILCMITPPFHRRHASPIQPLRWVSPRAIRAPQRALGAPVPPHFRFWNPTLGLGANNPDGGPPEAVDLRAPARRAGWVPRTGATVPEVHTGSGTWKLRDPSRINSTLKTGMGASMLESGETAKRSDAAQAELEQGSVDPWGCGRGGCSKAGAANKSPPTVARWPTETSGHSVPKAGLVSGCKDKEKVSLGRVPLMLSTREIRRQESAQTQDFIGLQRAGGEAYFTRYYGVERKCGMRNEDDEQMEATREGQDRARGRIMRGERVAGSCLHPGTLEKRDGKAWEVLETMIERGG
ncbi:hypothetical protein DFH09DRAFT_1280112 [Mycena vulgaris]|nr:hypothetical protein DFH09DRAFT_1280112 [Mycena vulgaris]